MSTFASVKYRIVLIVLCLFGVVTVSVRAKAAQSDTNASDLPDWVTGPRTAWGQETNGLRVGLAWDDASNNLGVSVLVMASKTNAVWSYVGPPLKKFLKVELRDMHGVILKPIKGKDLRADLPPRIQTDDLPRLDWHFEPDGRGAIADRLLLAADHPSGIGPQDIFVQDAYKIENEGDYTFTVYASVYEFAPDEKSVSRVDLLPVTAQFHLIPKIPKAK